MEQRLIVRTADRIKFVEHLLELGAKGGKLAAGSVPSYAVPFTAEIVVDVKRGEEFKSTPTIHAVPLPVEIYTKQQMEDMVWDDFREACAILGVKGRERAVMLEEYLKKSEHYITNSR